ncbi:MAG: 4Fe-4S binding protein [candidate division WS1 bacterium]|nr:4Fe-4S binding protein [candidate division WS1 bacterium]
MRKRYGDNLWDLLRILAAGAWSILVGLYITGINLIRPGVCERYPRRDHRPDYQPRPGYRGDFALLSDPERPGGLRCIACLQCQNICPDQCIHITPEGKGKDRHPVQFRIDTGLCQFCWLCVEVCPVAAITMTPDYETATDQPQKLIRDLDTLRERGRNIPEPQRVEPVGCVADGGA